MGATRLHAERGGLHQAGAAGFRIRFFLLENHHIHDVARHHAGDENGHSVVFRHRFSFRAGIQNLQIFYRILLMSHLLKIEVQKYSFHRKKKQRKFFTKINRGGCISVKNCCIFAALFYGDVLVLTASTVEGKHAVRGRSAR